jgi:hypothetical protein
MLFLHDVFILFHSNSELTVSMSPQRACESTDVATRVVVTPGHLVLEGNKEADSALRPQFAIIRN